MKKIIFAFIALFLFSACSKDNDNDTNNSSDGKLLGRWEAVGDYELENGIWLPTYTFNSEELSYEFKNNGKVVIYEWGTRNGEINYTFDSSNNELIMVGLVCKVSKLTNTELEIIGLSWDDDRMTYKTLFKRIQ